MKTMHTIQCIYYTYNRCEVENMKASLLGCGEGGHEGGGGEMSTEEKCLYEYNLTLSFEPTMGRFVYSYKYKILVYKNTKYKNAKF